MMSIVAWIVIGAILLVISLTFLVLVSIFISF